MPKMSPASLSVIIPVLEEEKEIAQILSAARALLEARGGVWEIIVVDNASTDQTCEHAAPFVNGTTIRLLRNDVNRGKGFSIRRGMLEASGELRLMCDADCVSSLDSLPRLLEAAEEADVAVGSRVAPGARVSRAQPWRRRLTGFGFLALTRLLMGRLTRDVYCGFKLWRADVARAVFQRSQVDGWAFDAEALAVAQILGYTISEVGIDWTNRPSSRLAIRQALVPALRDLYGARRSLRRLQPAEMERAGSLSVSREL